LLGIFHDAVVVVSVRLLVRLSMRTGSGLKLLECAFSCLFQARNFRICALNVLIIRVLRLVRLRLCL